MFTQEYLTQMTQEYLPSTLGRRASLQPCRALVTSYSYSALESTALFRNATPMLSHEHFRKVLLFVKLTCNPVNLTLLLLSDHALLQKKPWM